MLLLKTKHQFVCRDSLRSAEMVGSTTDLCILVICRKEVMHLTVVLGGHLGGNHLDFISCMAHLSIAKENIWYHMNL